MIEADHKLSRDLIKSLGRMVEDDRVYALLSDKLKTNDDKTGMAVADAVVPYARANTRAVTLVNAMLGHERDKVRRAAIEGVNKNPDLIGDESVRAALRNGVASGYQPAISYAKALAAFGNKDDIAFLREAGESNKGLKTQTKALQKLLEELEAR
ncbi:MAG: hypothetical protein AAF125_09615, partial [Chloroflexota bacterium]